MEDNKNLTKEEQAIQESRELLNDIKVFSKKTCAFLIIFVLLNFCIFIINSNTYTKNSGYPEARTYTSSALLMNRLYIYPLSKIFGWDSFVVKPFSTLRNLLFDIGYSKFPKTEGEREFWWYAIKYREYNDLVKKDLINWSLEGEPHEYLDAKESLFIQWDKELCNHIDSFANAKITNKTDKVLAVRKLANYTTYISGTTEATLLVNVKLQDNRLVELGTKKNIRSDIDTETVKLFDHIYDTYINLLNYSKIHEKESYDFYIKNPIHWLGGDINIYYLSLNILQSKFYSNKLDCNDKYVRIFAETQKKIRDYYFKNKNNMDYGLRQDAGYIAKTIDPWIAYKCQNSPYMKEYIQYALKKQSNKSIKNMNDIKNSMLKDYKNYEKDKYIQIHSLGIYEGDK